nr:hypothetical protein [Moraxella osloensis]
MKTICFAILSVSLISTAEACLPSSPADVLVGRIASIEKGGELQRESQSKQGFGLKFTDYYWAFRTWRQRLILPSAQRFEGVFAISSLKPNDIVVALASHYDGGKPHNYRIDSVAKLTCQNNQLILQNPLVIPVSWNRQQQRCGIGQNYAGILDGFIDNNQAYYLAKLQQKYPTCATLEKAFATVK